MDDIDNWSSGYTHNREEPVFGGLIEWLQQTSSSIKSETCEYYFRIVNGLIKQVTNHSGDFRCNLEESEIEQLDIGKIAADVICSKKAPATKAAYVSALTWALKDTGTLSQVRDQHAVLGELEKFTRSSQRNTRIARSRKSGRHIAEADLPAILNALIPERTTRQSWKVKTSNWLIAGIASGARPGEWQEACWVDRDRGVLRLPNAKLKTRAPFGWKHIPPRLLNAAKLSLFQKAQKEGDEEAAALFQAIDETGYKDLEECFYGNTAMIQNNDGSIARLVQLRAWELLKEQLAWREVEINANRRDAVDRHLESVRSFLSSGGKFRTYFENCRSAMRDACEKAFPDGRLYSLYDTRSTAAANMQADLGEREAANAMGHYSMESRTIRHNYAGADRAYSRGARCSARAADTATQKGFEAVRSEAQSLREALSIQPETDRSHLADQEYPLDDDGWSAPSISG
ncbi:hypothetical protein SAMN05444747_114106 [Variovorax sp. OV329]|nr:hypothetical protein SAMN05444747_114106 [Variovorax sp. OV329]